MKIKKQIIIILLVITLSMFSSAAYSQKLVFGAFENLPPYDYKENNQWVGIDIEIGNEIFKRLGIDAGYVFYPWTRLINTAREGKIAGILATFCSAKAMEERIFLEYPAEFTYTSKVSVFALKEMQIKVTGLGDLKDKSVGIIRGYSYSSEFDRNQDLKKVDCGDDERLIKILAKKRIYVGVAESAPFLYFSKKLGLQDKFEEVYLLTENPVCMAFSKKYHGHDSKILADKVSKIIRQLKDEGFIEKILNKYR